MRNFKLVALTLVLVSAFAITGCTSKRTYVSVNGEKITKKDFQERLERLPVPTGQGTPPQAAGTAVMNQLVQEKLILQLAKDKKVEPTEAQINNKLQMIKKDGNLNQLLAGRGITMEDFKRELTVNQAAINIMTKGVKVSDDDVKMTYEQALKSEASPFKKPESVEIALIMCSDRAKIDKAYGLLKTGAEFSTVAQQLSEDRATKPNGGIVGSAIVRNDRRVPKVFSATAFKLKPNEFSSPFEAPYMNQTKWFIVKTRSHKDAKVQSYGDVKTFLKEQIALSKVAQTTDFNKMLEDYRKKSDINVKVERYKKLVKTGKEDKK